jgi:hypothetical protein
MINRTVLDRAVKQSTMLGDSLARLAKSRGLKSWDELKFIELVNLNEKVKKGLEGFDHEHKQS